MGTQRIGPKKVKRYSLSTGYQFVFVCTSGHPRIVEGVTAEDTHVVFDAKTAEIHKVEQRDEVECHYTSCSDL